MGWFSSDTENSQNGDTKNLIKIDNSQSIDITSDEIIILLAVITFLLALIVLSKAISVYRKYVKKQTTRDAMLMKSISNLNKV